MTVEVTTEVKDQPREFVPISNDAIYQMNKVQLYTKLL